MHRLFATGGLVLCGDFEDAVGVNVERDFDLGDAPGRGGNAVQDELAQALVIGRHRALALHHVNLYLRLTVGGGGEYLALFGGNSGVALDQRGCHVP